jgi:hypothetical protein
MLSSLTLSPFYLVFQCLYGSDQSLFVESADWYASQELDRVP